LKVTRLYVIHPGIRVNLVPASPRVKKIKVLKFSSKNTLKVVGCAFSCLAQTADVQDQKMNMIVQSDDC
jgi:hypothetical protein